MLRRIAVTPVESGHNPGLRPVSGLVMITPGFDNSESGWIQFARENDSLSSALLITEAILSCMYFMEISWCSRS